MKLSAIGMALRLSGPLLEVIFLYLLLSGRGQTWSLVGIAGRYWLLAGILLGFMTWLGGLELMRKAKRSRE